MMNIHRLTTQNLPSIRVHDHQSLFESSYDDTPSGHAQRSLPRDIPFKHSSPTAIRGSHNRSDVPPPLPLLPMNWDSAGTSARERPGHPISPLWGSPSSGRGFVGSHESSRGTSFKRHEDGLERETRNGLSKLHIHERQPSMVPSSLQSEEDLMHERSNAYDKEQLRKLIHPPRTAYRPAFSPIDDGPFSNEPEVRRRVGQSLTPASSPISIGHRYSESPRDRFDNGNVRRDPMGTRMALSPVNPPVFPPMDYRSPASDPMSASSFGPSEDSFGVHRFRRLNSGTPVGSGSFEEIRGHRLKVRKSFDPVADIDDDQQMEDAHTPSHVTKMRQLTLGAETSPRLNAYPSMTFASQRAGIKRRASSPPNEDRAAIQADASRKNYENEPHARRSPIGPQPALRYSPGISSKFHLAAGLHSSSTPRSGSSFASSTGTGWSTNSPGASSIASSFATLDRHISPMASFSDLDSAGDSPYMSHSSLARSARPTNRPLKASDVQQTQERENPPPRASQNQASKQNFYICDCCPKKPKKFESKVELHSHEMEKQYVCTYCNNRFKNKNEAERHQNSLHLRKHSWSCAALAGPEPAFHPSTTRPNNFDICGYCGKEFGIPANWEVREDHLRQEHKFGECNQAKKFFRADHFRQHLKHSHSGTAGKWTNVLETACMRDEPAVDGGSAGGVAAAGGSGGGGVMSLGNSVISEE